MALCDAEIEENSTAEIFGFFLYNFIKQHQFISQSETSILLGILYMYLLYSYMIKIKYIFCNLCIYQGTFMLLIYADCSMKWTEFG